ncbi:ATP-binding protein [Spongiibacter sp.]|uniref:sensor histidine kinase n=1 Tax=Spongiibacter sp. TaxID=2024860 RepID=UPI0035647E26
MRLCLATRCNAVAYAVLRTLLLLSLFAVAEIAAAQALSASSVAPPQQRLAFSQALLELDERLDRGAVVIRFFDLLNAADVGGFHALQQRIASAELPLAALRELGGDDDAVAVLGALVEAYASYRVGSNGAVPLNAELDHRAMVDSLHRLQVQANQQLQAAGQQWQTMQWLRNGLMLLLALLLLVCVLLGRVLLRQRRALRAADLAREQQLERYSALMAAIPGAVLICDAEGRLLSASESASQLLGYRHGVLRDRPLKMLLAPQFHSHLERLLSDVEGRGSGFKGCEVMLLSHSGSEVAVELYPGWVDDPDGGRQLLLLIRDVSDHYLMYEQYQHSQQRFDLAVMASHDGIWDWNLLAGELYLSPAWLDIVGLSKAPEGAGLQTLLSCIPEADQDELRPIFVDFLKSKERMFNCEHRLRKRDGSLIEVKCQMAVQRSPDGWVTRMVGVHSDISSVKQRERQLWSDKHALEDRLRLQSMQLAEAERLAEQAGHVKSAFLSVIGHEFRTPMNAVVGMTDLLAKSSLNAEQRMMLDTILRSSQSLLSTLDNMIDYSLLESGSVDLQEENIQLWDYLEGVALVLAPLVARNRQQFVLDIDPRLPERLRADPIRLRQLLLILLENAVKFSVYSQPQGIVELVVRPAGDVEQQHYNWAKLVFEVRDNGVGVSEQDSRRLFSPFVQAESSPSRRFAGVGLGLAVAEKLVLLMGGQISVSSVDEGGSCFSVLLPAEELSLNTADDCAADDLHVLVVVADERLRLSLSAALSHRGLRARFCASAEAVQEYLQQHQGANTLLVSDADASWLEDCRTAGVAVVNLQQRPAKKEELGAVGADTVYINPMLPSRLYKAIDYCLADIGSAVDARVKP